MVICMIASHITAGNMILVAGNILRHTKQFTLAIRYATKKAGGSSKNGRDSRPKFLGVKMSGGSPVSPGAIILKQRGRRFIPSRDQSVGIGRDHTLYAKVKGTVVFSTCRKKRKKIVCVVS